MLKDELINGEVMLLKMKTIVIGILVILLSSGFTAAETLNVGTGQKYTTIQSAIDAAKPGDVISVNEGTYYENLIVKMNNISIIGKSKEKTIIDAKKFGSGIKIDQTTNVKISGFTIQNGGGSGQSDAGVTIYSAHNNTITNTILINNVVGISIYSESESNVISGNDIRSNTNYGIFIYSSGDNKIYNNNIQSNKIGIYADSARRNRIYMNNFIDNTDSQAYDNSGLNSWDDGSSGNFWNTHKTGGAYTISGVPKAKDNYPLLNAVTIKYEEVPVETGGGSKSSPGFTGLTVVVTLITIGILINKKKI
jgi:nitrous oxidase accessory protein